MGQKQRLLPIFMLLLQSCGDAASSQFVPGRVVEPTRQLMMAPTGNLPQAQKSVAALNSSQLVQALQIQAQKIDGRSTDILQLQEKIMQQITRHEECLAKNAFVAPYSKTIANWNEANRRFLVGCSALQQLFIFEFEKILSEIDCSVTKEGSPQDFELLHIKAANAFFQVGTSFGFWRIMQNSEGTYIQLNKLTCPLISIYQPQVANWVRLGVSRGVLRLQ
ncbi:MAG: hypothetical protein AAF310_00650 [Myxococcota bacterium]